MTPWNWRFLITALAVGVACGLALGGPRIARWMQDISASYGEGFVLLVALMTLLAVISIVRMPLSHAPARRRHR